MIIKIKPDKQKSESLKKMAEITLERLNKTNMEDYPSNTLEDYYDIIHKLLEALALKLNCPVFSGDKGLKKQTKVKIISPRELLDIFADI